MAGTAERRAREAGGRRAENLAVLALRLKGYRILARRYRNPAGEIDIVAARGRITAFIGVKERETEALALDSVTARQRQRIERAALAFLRGRRDLAGRDMRFDLIAVMPGKWPRHLIDAWRPGP